MDLCLYSFSPSIRLRPGTVHGMLWLQTHFEAEHWDLLADGLVTLPSADAEALRHDAIAAGLQVSQLPALSATKRI